MSIAKDETTPEPGGGMSGLLGGVLSYLVPGLGQIYQGRVGKGVLFLVCLYGMFFYGWYLGQWSNVYLPPPEKGYSWMPSVGTSLLNRLPFTCQFWIGAVAWPSIWQYNHWSIPGAEASPFLRNLQRTPPENAEQKDKDWTGKSINEMQADGDKTWDLGLVYTMVAGILNILVIYDAAAGPAFAASEGSKSKDSKTTPETAPV